MTTLMDFKYAYRLSLAQQRWVLDNVLRLAEAAGNGPSADQAKAALAIVMPALEVEAQYERERGTQADGGDAVAVDRQIDALVAAIHGGIAARAALGRRHPLGQPASTLLKDAFPDGLFHHVRAPFERQVHLNDRLVRLLTSPTVQPLTDSLALGALVAEVATLNQTFAGLLSPTYTVTPEDLRDARGKGEEATLRALMQIAATFDPADRGATGTRDLILKPLVEMNRRVRDVHRRRNRRAEDAEDVAVGDDGHVGDAGVPVDGAEAGVGDDGVAAGSVSGERELPAGGPAIGAGVPQGGRNAPMVDGEDVVEGSSAA